MAEQPAKVDALTDSDTGTPDVPSRIDAGGNGNTRQSAALAYQFWLDRGCPAGSPGEEWLKAEFHAPASAIKQMGTVLLLDDEQSLLKLTALYLRRGGYTIVPCASPASALEQFRALNGGVDLLIADVSLGRDSGVEFGLDLREWSPTLKVLFISGYPLAAWSNRDTALFDGLPPALVRVLQKPFSALDLLAKVEELIGPLAPNQESKGCLP